MSIPASGTEFTICAQNGKVGDSVFNGNAESWQKLRAMNINWGAKQIQQLFPQEIDPNVNPVGAYKESQFGAGNVDFIPRVEGTLGYFLYGALGNVVTTLDAKWHPTLGTVPAPGINTHVFSQDPTLSFKQPWMGIRIKVPGNTPSDVWGEEGYDSKVNMLRINIPAAGLLTASVSLQTRVVTFPPAAIANAWTYDNTGEDANSVPHAGKGSFLIGGVRYPITSLNIEVMNGLTNPQEEIIVGSPHPDDFIVKGQRQVRFRIMYKWENPDLYRRLMTNGPAGTTEWDSNPFLQETAGSTKAVEGTFYSPGNIPGTSEPYMFKFVANKVVWQIDENGIELRPGNIIMVPFIGTVLQPSDEADSYVDMILHNGIDYAGFAGANIVPYLVLSETQAFLGDPVFLSPAAYVEDGDSANFDTATLTATLAGADYDNVEDSLAVLPNGPITVVAAAISWYGTEVATFAGDGKTATPLVITFDPDATAAAVGDVIRAISYDCGDGGADGNTLTASFVLTDGDGGTSPTVVMTIDHII